MCAVKYKLGQARYQDKYDDCQLVLHLSPSPTYQTGEMVIRESPDIDVSHIYLHQTLICTQHLQCVNHYDPCSSEIGNHIITNQFDCTSLHIGRHKNFGQPYSKLR